MRTITFEHKVLNFDFSLGSVNDVYIKELGGSFDDLINMQKFENDTPRLIELARDILVSAHIYWLFCNGEDEEAEKLLTKIKSTKMIATKWVMQEGLINIVEWITEGLIPSELDEPKDSSVKTAKKK